MTTHQAAAALGLSLRAVQAYIKRGLIKAEKVGRDWHISEEETERFKKERRKPGQPKKQGE